MLKNKNIILGITGSIAAYKAAILVRLLVKSGANVKVVITPLGKEFITPVTLATLSKNTVLCDFFKHDDGEWNSHVDLGIWADLMLIAPATANTMAKMAHGVCDNLLLTTYLSAKCDVLIAPAMDLDMFSHPATLKNIEILKSYGNMIIEPSEGELASGLEGKGRMEEPDKIIDFIVDYLNSKKKKEVSKTPLSGKKILITAGPTHESIDAVRYLGNYSSGKMGFAIASELAAKGAEITMVCGPVSLEPSENINFIPVTSANEMFKACVENFSYMDGAVMAAAVADFTPLNASESKVKRGADNWVIELTPTKDISAELGRIKKDNQFLVGFALETDNESQNASIKLKKKNLDFIVLNSLNDKGAGFQYDTNKISIIDKDNKTEKFELKPKNEVARDIVTKIEEWTLNNSRS